MRSFELYFNDLSAEAKKKYLKFQRVSDESELNHEISPLAIIDSEDEENVDPCDSCKKQGETTCGNDTTNHECWEG